MAASKARDVLAWSEVGAVVYVLALWGAGALLRQDILAVMLGSPIVAAQLGLALLVAVGAAAFTNRKRAMTFQTLRSFLIQNVVAIAALLLVITGFSALARSGPVSLSAWIAAVTGSTLVAMAIFGSLTMASLRTDLGVVDDEVAAEDMRDRGRLFAYSFAWVGACGLLLIGLSLAGPRGVLSPAAGLLGAVVALALLSGLGVAVWRRSDELTRTLSHETGNMAFSLILGLGGGWALLAHLGFVGALEPLGWLTLFIVLLFVASFIVLGRRRMLTV